MGRPAVKETGERYYELQNLWDKHHEMIRLIALGYGNQEIAIMLGCTPQNVSDCRNSDIVKRRVEVLRVARDSQTVEVARALVEDAGKSYELLKEVRDGGHDAGISLRVQVAQDLLDRAGFGKVTKVVGKVLHGHLTETDLADIKARARGNKAVSAEFEEETENAA